MRVLALGAHAATLAQDLWPDAVVDTRAGKGRYGAVLAMNLLQTHSYRHAVKVLKEWFAMVDTPGELHVFVPSLEWAAEQILASNPSPATLLHLFGEQMDKSTINLCGFTMRDLRGQFEKAGIPVKFATTGQRVITSGSGEYVTEALYLCGWKHEQSGDDHQ